MPDFEKLLEVFFDDPADIVEVTAFRQSNEKEKAIGDYRPNKKLVETLEDFDASGEYNLYFLPNPVIRKLRPLFGTYTRAKRAEEIPDYRFCLMDGDPVRDFIRDADGQPVMFPKLNKRTGETVFNPRRHAIATEEEWQRTLEDMKKAHAFLRAEGIEKVPLASSGNGVHALPRLDLPNTYESKVKIAALQRLVSERFSTEHTVIQCFCDDTRITRLYGSLNRKGTPSEGREWRRSGLIYER
jgi:hypothetical protein